MPYKIALMDADNTLLDFTRSEYDALCECLSARGIPTHRDIIDRYSKINEDHWKMLERGEITREFLRINRFAQFFKEHGFDHDPAKMADDYLLALSTKSYLMDGAMELCQNLYGRCRLFIITNGNTFVQKGRFDPCPIAPLFENRFISEELGHSKPEKAYFDIVANMIPGFDPKETIVVGDSLTSDIQGGINAGLDTCWFNPKNKPLPEHMPVTYVAHSFEDIQRIILTD